MWVALSDATVDTGCMCVVPKHAAGGAERWYRRETLEMREVLSLLHASRALPVRAGGTLGWEAGLVHWGSARLADGEPRVSISMEFVPATAGTAVLAGALSCHDGRLPTLEERLSVIARSIALYHRTDARAGRYAELAEALAARL
jgi:ectoine hydroxylase-related dioxygenase (phytanoyl-CoA dioxygenase family)